MAERTKPNDPTTVDADRQRSEGKRRASTERQRREPDGGQETSGDEDMSGEGSPGLTITGGGGHA